MLKITIPKPCDEDWETMTPNQQGRHCNACAKTVVDFTLLSDEQVQQFFLYQKEERVCGRFKQEQLHRILITLPINILHITMPRWKQFLTACLLAFSSMLFSCDTMIDQNIKILGASLPEITEVSTTGLSVIKTKTDTTIKTNCSTSTSDTVVLDGMIAGAAFVEIIDSVFSKGEDSSKIFFTGKITLDSNAISPIIPVDTVTIKNPPEADSVNCNNMKYY